MNDSDLTLFGLKDFFREVYIQRIFLSGLGFFILLFSVVFFLIHEERWKLSLNINEVGVTDINLNVGLIEYNEFIPFNSEILRETFVDELIDREEITLVLKNFFNNQENQNLTQPQLDNLAKQMSYNFTIKRRLTNESDKFIDNIENQDIYIFSHITKEPSNLKIIMGEIIEKVNETSKETIKRNVNEKINEYENARLYKIQNKKIRIQYLIDELLENEKNKLIELSEAYELAKSLNINSNLSIDSNNASAESGPELKNFDLYLEGTRVLEQKMLIQQRKIDKSIVLENEEISDLKAELSKLDNDEFAKRIKNAYSTSYLLSKDSKLASYDIGNIKSERINISKFELIVVINIIGFILLLIYITVRAWLRKLYSN